MSKVAQEIKAAMAVEPGYAMKTKASVKALVEAGHAEVNETITEGKGATAKFAVRLTDAGMAALAAAPEAAPAVTSVVIEGFVPSRTRETTSKYPLDTLAIGQSLFFTAPDVKRLASSLSSAATGAHKRSGTKRYSVSIVKAGKQYGAFTPTADGVVVVRIADKAAA